MAVVISRLEQALQAWEDLFFFLNARHRVYSALGVKIHEFPFTGPVKHAPEFREYLLSLRGTSDQFDHDRFVGPLELQVLTLLGGVNVLPEALACWTLHSRRVFQVTDELQHLLDATALTGVQWSAVPWPFPSFVVLPPVPILDERGRRYDCILVSSQQSDAEATKKVCFHLFSTSFDNQVIITPRIRKMLLREMQKRAWRKAAEVLGRIHRGLSQSPHISCFNVTDEYLQRLVTEPINREEKDKEFEKILLGRTQDHPEWGSAARIVAGLCLYLTTLPSSSPHRSSWRPAQKTGTPDTSVLTDTAQICEVSSIYTLTLEEREVLGLEGEERQRPYHEVRTHFRRGHWRRSPGYGHLPDALRTIWVRPTLVRRDRLPDTGLPGGTKAIL